MNKNKEKEVAKEVAKKRYRSIIQRNLSAKRELAQEAFIGWWEKNEDKCHYCHITTNEIRKLLAAGEIRTKRLGTRGLTMEVDRKDPKKGYTLDNIIKCCYWCNNAKTDEFSEDEFCYISKGIECSWRHRLRDLENKEEIDYFKKSPMCEWDEPSGVVFAVPWGMNSASNKEKYWKILKKLIDDILSEYKSENFTVILLFKDRQGVRKALEKNVLSKGKDSDEPETILNDHRVKLMAVPHLDDVWLRDFMPIALQKNSKKAIKAVYSPPYFEDKKMKGCKGCRKYSWNSHMAGLETAEKLGFDIQYLSKSGSGFWFEGLEDPVCKEMKTDGSLPIILDGGNLIHNGEIGLVSEQVVKDNIDEKFPINEINEIDCSEIKENIVVQELIAVLKSRLYLQRIYILPIKKVGEKPDPTGHLGGTIRFLNEKTLLVDKTYHDDNKKFFECLKKKENRNGNDLEILPIEQPIPQPNSPVSAFGMILDYLRIGNIIFLPKFENNEDKKNNLKDYLEKKDKNIKVVCVEEDGSISKNGGVFNSIAWVY